MTSADHLLPANRAHRDVATASQDGILSVIGHINIQVSIAIHIGDGPRVPASLIVDKPGGLGRIREFTRSVVQQQGVRPG